jgi:hypothetical protein
VSFAQEVHFKPIFINYGVEAGMPTDETYHVYNDRNDRVWFASNRGVGYFKDGAVRYFNEGNNLSDNTVFKIKEDYKGRIWFSTYNNLLSYFENDTIHSYKYNDTILKYLPKGLINISLIVDKEDNVHLGFKTGGYYKINKEGTFSFNSISKYSDEYLYRGVVNIDNDILTFVGGDYNYNLPNNTDKTNFLFFNNDVKKIEGQFKYAQYSDMIHHSLPYGVKLDSDLYANLTENKIIISSSDKIIKMIEKKNSFISINIIDNKLWGGLNHKGVFEFDIKGDFKQKNHFLKSSSVSGMCKDGSGGYWFSTLETGLYYTGSLGVSTLKYEDSKSNITSSAIINNNLYLGFHNGTIEQYDLETFQVTKKTKEGVPYQPVVGFIQLQKTKNIIPIGNFKELNKLFKREAYTVPIQNDYYPTIKFFLQSDSLNYYITYNNKIKGKGVSVEPKININKAIIYNDSLFVGSENGLFQLVGSALRKINLGRIKKESIKDLSTKNQSLFIAFDSEIYIYVKGKVEKISLPNKCTNITAIKAGLENQLYIACDLGLVSFDINEHSCKILNQNYGILTTSIQKIMETGNLVFLQSNREVWQIEKSVFNSVKQKMKLTKVVLNDAPSPILSDYELSYDNNQVEIKYAVLGVSQRFEIYKYQMVGSDKRVITTSNNFVRYPSLAVGKYKFSIKGSSDGLNFSDPLEISFTVTPPFWLTSWFIVMEILLTLFLVYIVLQWRVNSNNKKNSIKNEMLELKSCALRAQMNPHFTFNVLNSIQSLIVRNNVDEASIYLAEFSKLMRLALEASINNEISLKDELSIIEKYLILEKLRFKEKLQWSISVNPIIKLEESIVPPMFIQPLVENAIIHGVLEKNELDGKVDVKIELDTEERLIIKIYNTGSQLKSNPFTSENFGDGLSIIHQRLKGLDKRNSIELNSINENGMATCALIILNKTTKDGKMCYC